MIFIMTYPRFIENTEDGDVRVRVDFLSTEWKAVWDAAKRHQGTVTKSDWGWQAVWEEVWDAYTWHTLQQNHYLAKQEEDREMSEVGWG